MASKQIGSDLIFIAYFLNTSAALVTGLLDVVFTVYRNGVTVVTGQAAVATGDGYSYTLPGASVTAAGSYWAEATTASGSVVQQVVPVGTYEVGDTWIENLDAAISSIAASIWTYGSRTLTSVGTVTIVTPLDVSTGLLTLIRGDSYMADINRAITWTDPGDWPDLTTATVEFKVQVPHDNINLLTVPMTFIAPDTVQLELTSDQTAGLSSIYAPELRKLLYEVSATLVSTEVVTLASGDLHLVSDLV